MQEKLILLKEQNKMTNKKMAEILGITPNQYRKKDNIDDVVDFIRKSI